MGKTAIDWAAVHADPRFQALHRRKTVFISGLAAISLLSYFSLPVGAAYFPDLFRIRIAGAINLGLVLAFFEFIVVFVVAAIYTRRANNEFDRLSEEISREILAGRLPEAVP